MTNIEQLNKALADIEVALAPLLSEKNLLEQELLEHKKLKVKRGLT